MRDLQNPLRVNQALFRQWGWRAQAWPLASWVRDLGVAWLVPVQRGCLLQVVVAHFATGRFVLESILVRAVVHQSTYPSLSVTF